MNTTPSNANASATCAVVSCAVVEARLSAIGGLREKPSPAGAAPLPHRFLRHCDEQTVLGMRAVLEAIAGHPEPRPAFDRFGVVAAPCQSGRIAAAQTLSQLKTGGAAVVSPHIVPQGSLHAMASAVSVALGMHGPNIGTSGGPQAFSEGLFTALSLVHAPTAAGAERCAGIWLIATAWDEEPRLDATGKPETDPLCRAVAIAITRAADAGAATTLTLEPVATTTGVGCGVPDAAGAIAAFGRALKLCGEGGVLESWSHVCPWGAEIRMAAQPLGSGSACALRREAA